MHALNLAKFKLALSNRQRLRAKFAYALYPTIISLGVVDIEFRAILFIYFYSENGFGKRVSTRETCISIFSTGTYLKSYDFIRIY